MIYEQLTDNECYLYALTQDESGLDLAEFCYIDETSEDGCFRAWPIQYAWWRKKDQKQISAGSRSVGKALAVDTPIFTLDGWKLMGDIEEGDFVLHPSGAPNCVIETHEIYDDRPCYQIDFSNGGRITADSNHLWVVWDDLNNPLMVTTHALYKNYSTYKIPEQQTAWAGHIAPKAVESWITIDSVIKVEPQPTRCITVESDDGMFLAGQALIPTHNSLSIKFRAFAFPFLNPGEEMIVTAPENIHLEAVTDNIETLYVNNKLASEMIVGGRGGITHRPFRMNFSNGARIMGRIPQLDGSGIKGCFEKGTLVLTRRGCIPIEAVEVGDIVFTHLGNWKKVTHTWIFQEETPVRVQANRLSEGVVCSGIEPFWARYGNTLNMKQNEPEWCFAKDLAVQKNRRHRWNLLSPAEFPEETQPAFPFKYDEKEVETLYWLFGLYQAEGSSSIKSGQVTFSVHEEEVDCVKSAINRIGYNAGATRKKGLGMDVYFSSQPFITFLREEFKACKEKTIPVWMYGAPRELKEAFFSGALYGDGCWRHESLNEYITVIRSLAYEMKMFAQSLGYVASVHRNNTSTNFGDNGWYRVLVSDQPESSNFIDGHIMSGVQNVEELAPMTVYDLTVEDDHSFTANSVFARNTHPIWLEQDEACFPGETLVFTHKGHIRIDEIEIGDYVLTHKNRWKKVLNVWDRGERETINVKGFIVPTPTRLISKTIRVTPNHRFYAKKSQYSPTEWIRADELKGCLWSYFVDGRLVFGAVGKEYELDPEICRVYDIEVEDDHSFVAEGIVVHNSDYPEKGWDEIVETVKVQNPKARWRAHGVTRGVGDKFDEKISGSESEWAVIRLPAMYRPNWTDNERKSKIEEYHGYDSPNYRRNILGLPGDNNSPMFVLHRIMANVVLDLEDNYNAFEYYNTFIDEAMIREVDDILELIDIPASHSSYSRFWIGMDFGWTQAPSAIAVFAEIRNPKKDETSLKLLTKIILKRVAPIDQFKVIMHLMEVYRPIAYAMDGTGAGQPVVSLLENKVEEDPSTQHMFDRIKSYNFSQKVIVGFDNTIKIDERKVDGYMDAAIYRPFLEASADAMRVLIDNTRFMLPYDKEVIGELQSTPKNTRTMPDAYGKSTHKKTGQHTLDAMRMAVMAYSTTHIDEFIAAHQKIWVAPSMIFLD